MFSSSFVSAGLVQFDKFYELVTHLGLSDISWNNNLEQYRGYDLKVVNFVALCEWRQQKKQKIVIAYLTYNQSDMTLVITYLT
jgi:hypothetical protein